MLTRPAPHVGGGRRYGGGAEVTPTGSGSGAPPRLITRRLLREWRLQQPEPGADKEERGRVLVVGGAAEMPGAVILAATAALRAGAGKLRIATAAGIASSIAVAVPEARVFRVPETDAGAVTAAAAPDVIRWASEADAVVIGPGMVDEDAVA